MKFSEKLKSLAACKDAVTWVGNRTLKKAWAECERPEWMLWLCGKMIGKRGWPTHQEIVLIACWCARRAQKYWHDEKDVRPMKAIEAAEKWAKDPTEENRSAANASANASSAAAAAAAAAAADADAAMSSRSSKRAKTRE